MARGLIKAGDREAVVRARVREVVGQSADAINALWAVYNAAKKEKAAAACAHLWELRDDFCGHFPNAPYCEVLDDDHAATA